MSQTPVSISKHSLLKPAEDYYFLRREGIRFIEEMGSSFWTDYNAHDPGITILESLCYAITELAYRTGWDIKDILASRTHSGGTDQPFPDQPFFTAGEILTVNPWSPDDFRRLLIDLDSVRNAWVLCDECARNTCWPERAQPQGLYDILLELEIDPEFGNLNDRKIELGFFIWDDDGIRHSFMMEVRFPEWGMEGLAKWQVEKEDSFELKVSSLGAAKTYNLLADSQLEENDRDKYLREHWRSVFYLDFELIEKQPGYEKVVAWNATLRLFGDDFIRSKTTVSGLIDFLADKTPAGVIRRYKSKQDAAAGAIKEACKCLHEHRNLGEDYCRIKVVGIEEVGVCADIELKPDADIEKVQAHIWFELERYFSPTVPFYSLGELMEAGEAVEEIFNGPPLKNGFIRAADLESASLRTVLRVSDIINRLMDIDGVLAVNNMQLVKFDHEGNVMCGAADPAWTEDGKPFFEAGKANASWLLYISEVHQPRFNLNASRFLFYKNGLPFLPRMDEACDTLTQLRGEAERPKIKNAPQDLPLPEGKCRCVEEYYPLQYSLPSAYGIGPEGLPSSASDKRRAQARQLRAYLMPFEQFLANAFSQLANATDLFSLNQNVSRTYFICELNGIIRDYDEIADRLDRPALEAMAETPREFQERRNRFLDHIIARFGEQFCENIFLLNDLQGRRMAPDQLIQHKISFLKECPEISRDRGKSFNYTGPISREIVPGIQRRISRLLGCPDLKFIVVEHLLLRPKFPGDALLISRTEDPSDACRDDDPYSFRLTFVMAGWTEPYGANLEMRNFADRTIRQETPSHLLSRICWIGNDGFIENPCDPVIEELAEFLSKYAKRTGGAMPSDTAAACDCAAYVYSAFSSVFREWYHGKTLDYFHADALYKALEAEFSAKLCFADMPCSAFSDTIWPGVLEKMVRHFRHISLHGCLYERFEDAWMKWLEANAKIDWIEENLQERVEAVLKSNLLAPHENGPAQKDAVCRCAAAILQGYGGAFYSWMEENIRAGKALEEFTDFAPAAVTLCPDLDFKTGTAELIKALLNDRYSAYKVVSFRLWVVTDLLSRLRSIYPAATLHDFDEGNDRNPVRLGKTNLGS